MTSNPESGAAASARNHGTPKNPLSPKKLLLTKWTAVTPRNREKHFVVVRVIEPELPSMRVEQVELEAVHSMQAYLLHWRELTDASLWRQGWV
ncbi:MAG: TIGR02450 family Trp-rich protein [Polaromonas sp.]|nr:TIGR02450 family Trp-rich protein [Gemmatimonadaceae bacterium]